MAVSCVVGAAQAFLPFSDPAVDETSILECFQSRIDVEIARQTQLSNITTFERHPHHLLRILRRYNYNVEQSIQDWCGWITWRREQRIDEITDDIIRCDMDAKLIEWKGQDKQGRLCCIVTGRFMNPVERRSKNGTGSSFQKYLIRSVEDGCRLAIEHSSVTSPPTQQQIDRDDTTANSLVSSGLDAGPDFCIVYDRRGLDWQHIDPMLYKLCRNTIDDLRTHYGSRVGMIYILHTNWIYRVLFLTILRPFLALFSSRGFDRLILVQSLEELYTYFDRDQLHLIDPI